MFLGIRCGVQARSIRFRRRSGFARPYMAVLSCLMRLTVPSTAPELWSRVSPATTASRSRRSPAVNDRSVGRSGVDGADPLDERVLVAGQVLDHPGEPGDVPDGGVQLGAAVPDRVQPRPVGRVEVAREDGDPAGDLPHRRRRRAWVCECGCVETAERS